MIEKGKRQKPFQNDGWLETAPVLGEVLNVLVFGISRDLLGREGPV